MNTMSQANSAKQVASRMRRWRTYGSVVGSVMLVLGLAVLGGCGGGGSDAPTTPSPFAGQWNGTWWGTGVGVGHDGLLSLTVNEAGTVTGTTFDNQSQAYGTIRGTISAAGSCQLTCTYPVMGNSTIVGQVSVNAQGQLRGSVTQTWQGYAVPGQVSLDPA